MHSAKIIGLAAMLGLAFAGPIQDKTTAPIIQSTYSPFKISPAAANDMSTFKTLKPRQLDCSLVTPSAEGERAGAWCKYKWINTRGRNYLEYDLDLESIGLGPGDPWCDSLRLAVEKECKLSPGEINSNECGQFYSGRTADPGLHYNVKLQSWQPGKDNRDCVAKAIVRGSCGYDFDLTDKTCVQTF